MPVTAREMVRRLQRAEAKIDSDVKTILKMLEKDILDLNRDDQLFKEGLGTDGKLLGVYSKATEEMTQGARGPGFPKRAGEPYNFYDTGSMFKAYGLRAGRDKFTIYNTSLTLKAFSKSKGVPESRIIGLTTENQQTVNYKMVLPLLRDFFRRNIA